MVEKERFREHETCEQKGQCERLGECWRAHLIDHELGYVKINEEDSRSTLSYVVRKTTCKHPQVLESLKEATPYVEEGEEKKYFVLEEMGSLVKIEFTDNFLEPREREILAGVITHNTHKDIADKTELSIKQIQHSVDSLKQKVQEKMGVWPFDTRKAIFELISMGVLSIDREGSKNEF